MTRAASSRRGVNRYQPELTPPAQLTLSLEPGLVDRHASLRAYIAHRITLQPKLQKQIAADMDHSPSLLSKKLSGEAGNAFTCDDLEGYIASTGDLQSVLEYLATKFGANDAGRQARAVSRLEALLSLVERELPGLKAGAA